jgi:hypothetical protein
MKTPAQILILLQRRDHLRYLLRRKQIIGIQKANNLALTLIKPVIEGRCLPAVSLQHDLDPIGIGGEHFGGMIGGAIIHHDHFDRPIGLG